MDCPHIPEINVGAFGDALSRRLAGERYPITGSIELTLRCNVRCQHCYVSHGHTGVPGKQELSTVEFKRIFDEITDAGTLWLLLTGGEPLMRRDFPELYTYALRKGMLLTLFTNGTLLTPRSADFLAEWRPQGIEISLYGYTQETYERVTGVPGSHARAMRGIELLLERGLPLKLKTMAMTLNAHEVPAMQSFAESLGVDFRFDGMLNESVVPGCGRPLELRLSPEEIVQLDLADDERVDDFRRYFERSLGVPTNPQTLFQCGAGIGSYHIDPFGFLSLCTMVRWQGYDLRNGAFAEGWQELGRQRSQPPRQDNACITCELSAFCNNCPGWSAMEHGDPDQPVAFQCQVTALRARALGFIPLAQLETLPLRQEIHQTM